MSGTETTLAFFFKAVTRGPNKQHYGTNGMSRLGRQIKGLKVDTNSKQINPSFGRLTGGDNCNADVV